MLVDYLFIDMNSFFASVEQQLRPELRGRPTAVIPVDAETTSVIAASYEAKKTGVRTGTPVRDARRLCPGIALVPARHREYVRAHKRILAAIETCLPIDAVASIDEMVCRLIGDERRPESAMQLARAIKAAIAMRAGECLKCSIGLAPNRLLAKVASDMQKPDGLTLIRKSDLPARLHPLQLQDLPGIGPRMDQRLRAAEVHSVARLCELTIDEMSRVWGSKLIGEEWWRLLRGEDLPRKTIQHRSVGHSHVLPPAFRNEAGARAIFLRLIDKAAARMRSSGHCTASLSLSITFLDAPAWDDRHTFPLCQDTLRLVHTGLEMWNRKPRGTPVRIGIVLGELVHSRNAARSLFEEDERGEELSRTLDDIRGKFGVSALYLAGMTAALPQERLPIAFRHIPDPTVPGFG